MQCTAYGTKRTFRVALQMSALVVKRTRRLHYILSASDPKQKSSFPKLKTAKRYSVIAITSCGEERGLY